LYCIVLYKLWSNLEDKLTQVKTQLPAFRDVASIFGLGGLSPEAYLLPFLLPFLPRLLLPSLSFSFSFGLLPFSSRILSLWKVPILNLATSGEHCGITSSQHCGGKGTHCTASQCSRGTIHVIGSVPVYLKLELVRLGPDGCGPADDYNSALKPWQATPMQRNGFFGFFCWV